MKSIIAIIKIIINKLLQPVGPLSKELAPYDSVDKPVLCYEQTLYLVALGGTGLAKVTDLFSASASHWSPVHIIALVLVVVVILVAVFNLLFPPHLSASRLVFVVLNMIWFMMLIGPR